MSKTTIKFDWCNGYQRARKLSRSFSTLEEAKAFSAGKEIVDIYRSKGIYKVEWIKRTHID